MLIAPVKVLAALPNVRVPAPVFVSPVKPVILTSFVPLNVIESAAALVLMTSSPVPVSVAAVVVLDAMVVATPPARIIPFCASVSVVPVVCVKLNALPPSLSVAILAVPCAVMAPVACI